MKNTLNLTFSPGFFRIETGYYSKKKLRQTLIENEWAGLTSSGATRCTIGLLKDKNNIVVLHDDSTQPVKQLEILSKKDTFSISRQSQLILCYNRLFHSDQQIHQWDSNLKKQFPDMTITWKQITNFDKVGLTITGEPILINNILAVYSSGKFCQRFLKSLLPCVPLNLDHQPIPTNVHISVSHADLSPISGTPIENLNKNGPCHNMVTSVCESLHQFALACCFKLPR